MIADFKMRFGCKQAALKYNNYIDFMLEAIVDYNFEYNSKGWMGGWTDR